MSEQDEVVRQLTQMLEQATGRLRELRDQVERTEALAQVKVQSAGLTRELDRAYRDLGEALSQAVKANELTLPKSLEPTFRLVRVAEEKQTALRSQIADLLLEGEAAAGRRPAPPKAGVETRTKKR